MIGISKAGTDLVKGIGRKNKSMKKAKKGKFIVLDGADGSGKATQAKILANKLKKEGYKVEELNFPQYGTKSAGLVEEYLNGNFGTAQQVGPYRASILYACDRYAASFKIRKWIEDGKIVICDRYVTANMGHQGGKIASSLERKKYFRWLYDLEYKIFSIPKPDVNLILHVDAVMAQKMVDLKSKRSYIKNGKRDIHENDLKHLRAAEKVYLEIAKDFPDFQLIECVRDGVVLSREEIGDLIWKKLKNRI
jgi:dTMP kinase